MYDMIKDMYDGEITSVRAIGRETNTFLITVAYIKGLL